MKKEGGYSRNSFLLLTHHQWIAVLVAIVCHRSRIQGLPIHGHPCIRGSYVNHRSSVLARIHYQRCTHSPSSSSSDSMYLRKSQRRHPSCSATVASIDGPWRDDIFQTYWNEQPLLIRQAFAAQKKKEEEKEKHDESTITKLVAILDTTTAPITWESMMDLANQGRGGSRFIQHEPDGPLNSYTVKTGPFSTAMLQKWIGSTKKPQSSKAWTLVLNDVDRHIPQVGEWIDKHFGSIPRWRRDDAQVSCSGVQGGIGPHVDNYDVFLIQMQGDKTWKIGYPKLSQSCERQALEPDIDVSILRVDMMPLQWEDIVVHPGDVLYLPPRIVHWGISHSEKCMTLSVGCRAPTALDITMRVVEELQSQSREMERYSTLPQAKYPSLDAAVKEEFKIMVRNAIDSVMQNDAVWDTIVGQLITDPIRFYDFDDDDDENDEYSEEETQKHMQGLPNQYIRATGYAIATSLVQLEDGRTVYRLFMHGKWWEIPASADDTENEEIELTLRSFEQGKPITLPRSNKHSPLNDMLQDLIEEGFLEPHYESQL